MTVHAHLSAVYTPHIGRDVWLREGTSDRQVWADVFTGGYHLPPADTTRSTVLDLGANIGLTAAHYRYLWPGAEVVAVEMDHGNAEIARLNAPGVTVREEAVAAEGGVALYDDGADADAFALGASEGRTAMRRTLRSIILRSFGALGVDFVKMDVEGEEWNLLAAAEDWTPLVRSLVVELHDRRDTDPLNLAFEIADAIANEGGYADDSNEADRRADERDRLSRIVAATLKGEEPMISAAVGLLEAAGFHARRHPPHPAAVYAWR